MKFRVVVSDPLTAEEKEVAVEVAISLKVKFGPQEAAKKLGLPVSQIMKVIRVS